MANWSFRQEHPQQVFNGIVVTTDNKEELTTNVMENLGMVLVGQKLQKLMGTARFYAGSQCNNALIYSSFSTLQVKKELF
jgi:hypothetical protein